jgi:hypothetical protein
MKFIQAQRLLQIVVWFQCVTASLVGVDSQSAVHSGVGYAELDSAWDFSDSATCSLFEGYCGDFAMGINGGWFLLAMPPDAGIAIVADSTFEELTTAPEDPDRYFVIVYPYPNEVYVVRTEEGHYAKIRPIDLNASGEFTFEYRYQDDGSRVLDDTVPVEATSWGRIKALYLSGDN